MISLNILEHLEHLDDLVDERRSDAFRYWGLAGYQAKVGNSDLAQYYKEVARYYWRVSKKHESRLVKLHSKLEEKEKKVLPIIEETGEEPFVDIIEETGEEPFVDILECYIKNHWGWKLTLVTETTEGRQGYKLTYQFTGDLVNIKSLKEMLYTFQDINLPYTDNRLLLVGVFQTMTELSDDEVAFASKFYALSYSANDIRFLINESLYRFEEMFKQNSERYLVTSVEGLEGLVLTVWYSESEQELARQQR